MKKDDSFKMFGVCLLFFGMGLFLGTEKASMMYIASVVACFALFLIFLAKPVFRYLGIAFKEVSENM